jgi:hypothetical protein
VRERFGIEYTLAGLDVLLHRIGWSVQVPARRAAERDEAAIAAWREELNPVEAVWSNLKRSLANLTKQGIDQLAALIKARLKPMQYRPGLLDGFLARTGLDLTPSVTSPIEGPLAGQPLGLGTAVITVYWQHGVLEARVWPLAT